MSNNPFINDGQNISQPVTTNAPMPGAPNSNDSFEIDLTNIEGNLAIPDGVYRAKCINVEQTVSKSGNPMFVWDFELLDADFTGRTIKSWTAITPAAMWKVAETVMALGVGQSGEVVKFKQSDVINKECGVVIEATEYNGRTSPSISRVVSIKELKELKS